MTELDGNDVSHWQGHIDWAEAVAQTSFEMVKASQGTAEVDSRYAENIAGLRARGERRGSYHYADGGDPIAEARHYVAAAGRRNGEMQALDFEGRVLLTGDPVGWAHAFLAEVIRLTDNRPLIYMSGSVVTRFDWSRVIALNVGLWCASWESAPVHHLGQWPFVIMWQRDDNGHLAGVGGLVDQDVFFGDGATWAKYANNIGDAAPHPSPTPHPAPAPAPHPTGEYTVRQGDTLTSIAAAHHSSVHELVALNEARHPSLGWNANFIQTGWILTLPAGAHHPTPPAPAPRRTHRVVAGDTLSGLAQHYGMSLARLAQLNVHHYPTLTSNPDHIEVGWLLTV